MIISKQEINAIRAVVDYLYPDESEDYKMLVEEGVLEVNLDLHILHPLEVLQSLLEKLEKDDKHI